jgi:hypothetical protein
MHYAAVSLVGLQVSNESTLLLSLAVDRLRTVLAVKGSLRRAEDGAPLTAPGRSEEPYLIRRERRIGKSMTLTAQHLATFNRRDHVRATKPRGTCTAAGGWMPKISRRPARGRDFSLDIPFYRTGRKYAHQACCELNRHAEQEVVRRAIFEIKRVGTLNFDSVRTRNYSAREFT